MFVGSTAALFDTSARQRQPDCCAIVSGVGGDFKFMWPVKGLATMRLACPFSGREAVGHTLKPWITPKQIRDHQFYFMTHFEPLKRQSDTKIRHKKFLND
jgi:hypothetical protein